MKLTDLGLSPDDDPGTTWHPKPEKWDGDHLADLDDDQVAEHAGKLEAAEQVDAGRSLSAEDSAETPGGEI